MKYEWDFVPFPTGPSGSKDSVPGSCNFDGIGNGAESPEGGAAFIYLTRKNSIDGREGYLSKYLTNDQITLLNSLRAKVAFSKKGSFNLPSDKLIKDIKKGTPVATVLETFKPIFQGEIDNFLNEVQKN